MRNEIQELFPELSEIGDVELREKVIDVWEDAIKTGGWTPAELMKIPFTLLAGETKMMFVEHVRACCLMCIAVEKVLGKVWGERMPIHRDHLIAGYYHPRAADDNRRLLLPNLQTQCF